MIIISFSPILLFAFGVGWLIFLLYPIAPLISSIIILVSMIHYYKSYHDFADKYANKASGIDVSMKEQLLSSDALASSSMTLSQQYNQNVRSGEHQQEEEEGVNPLVFSQAAPPKHEMIQAVPSPYYTSVGEKV